MGVVVIDVIVFELFVALAALDGRGFATRVGQASLDSSVVMMMMMKIKIMMAVVW